MCGRYTLRHPSRLDKAFDPVTIRFDAAGLLPRFNVAPRQEVPIVRMNRAGEGVIDLARWGLIPSWNKSEPKVQPINARAETVSTSGMFKQAYTRRRCLIPADGFYEWHADETGEAAAKTKSKSKASTFKTPYFFRLKSDEIYGFAGLWERWRPDEDAEPIETCTMLTTEPNAVVKPYHDRMPLILAAKAYDAWLSRETPMDDIARLLRPLPANRMESWEVSTLVNTPRNDEPDCVTRVE